MREIFAKSLQDGTMIEMGRDTSPICEIMEIGKYTGELQYETQMTGAQLVEFIKKHKYAIRQEIANQVNLEHDYRVVAWDW